MSGESYSSTHSALNGFYGAISGDIDAKEATYSIWVNAPNNPTDWKKLLGFEYDNDDNHFGYLSVDSQTPSRPKAYVKKDGSNEMAIQNSDDSLSGWKMVTFVIREGTAYLYVNGVLDGSSVWYYPGLEKVTKLALGRGTNDGGADSTFDEATFSTIGRSVDWLLASYRNQKPDQSSNPYLNFGNLVGPISLNDDEYTKIYGKKDTTITSYTVAHSGNGSFSATGLPPGLSINSATGVISGSTSVTGSQNVTITATGSTAGGGSVTVTKVYTVVITDPTSFPFRMNLTLSGYTGSSTLSDFPVLVSLSSSITGFSYNGMLDTDGDGVRTGGDLRFFASSGQELAYEIADWNTSGTSHIWVKVPSISGTNTVITAAWGKTGTETTPDYASNDPVWSNGYEGVWHLDNISSATTNDSSPSGNHLTQNGGASMTAGQIGNAISLDGTDDELEAVGYKGITGSAARSMQLWVKTAAVDDALMSWGENATNKKWVLRTETGLRLRVEVNGGGRESNSLA